MQLSQQEKIEKLNSMKGISSGKLAVENFFCLTDDDLHAKAKVLDEDKKKQSGMAILEQAKKDEDAKVLAIQ